MILAENILCVLAFCTLNKIYQFYYNAQNLKEYMFSMATDGVTISHSPSPSNDSIVQSKTQSPLEFVQ